MKKLFLYLIVIFLTTILMSACSQTQKTGSRKTISFDADWRFLKDNPTGAEDPSFDDSQWRNLSLPHDWSIEDLPDQTDDSIIGPFSKASHGKMGTGYTIGGTAWYRKGFRTAPEDKNKSVWLVFDGVYMNSDVWVNGKHAGNHPYGYTSFYYDITPFLNPTGEYNTVAVQVKNEGRNARWYSGSGIYRHTWLVVVNPVHINMWGVWVKTPEVSERSAGIDINIRISNSGSKKTPVIVSTQIIDPAGNIVGAVKNDTLLEPSAEVNLEQKVSLDNPSLWSPESPALYKARVAVIQDGKETDDLSTPFGIRSIHVGAEKGLTLNGRSIELKGGCFHHDNGPLGSAAINRAEERKMELLKGAGYNAIRCSHNPPSPYLLDVCDRLGMLVIDEFADMWERPKISPDDYSKYFKEWWKKDLTTMILRDRNHPSVIMWSIGNEIFESADSSGLRIAKNLSSEVHQLDPSRPVTEAMVDIGGFLTGHSLWDKMAPHMALLDVVGYNYGFNRYEADHAKFPLRIMMATEFMPPLSLQNWQLSEKLPYVIGNFSWTAMDYLGESGVGLPRLVASEKTGKGPSLGNLMGLFFNENSWPVFNDFQGDLDLIGTRKAPSFYQHVVWGLSKIEILVHRPLPQGMREITSMWGFPDELKSWSWPGHEGEKIEVHVYTRSPLVKLELNGKVIGEQNVDTAKSITATFEVPYQAGSLTARCFDNGSETASQTIKTTGAPASVRLTVDRSTINADANDLAYVLAELVDWDGNVVPYADSIMVNFKVNGAGSLAGVGSGNPSDMSSFQQPQKKSYQGRCLLIVKPELTPGKITVTGSAEGLKESTVEIMTVAVSR
jgi:beta-galactosidase